MPKLRMPPRQWQLEDDALIHPTGRRIPLNDIEDWFRAAWGGNQSIQTDRWRGWRIVQQYLVPPGRTIRDGIHINALRSLAHHLGLVARRNKERVLQDDDDA